MLHLLPQVIIHAQKNISFYRRSFNSLEDGLVVEIYDELVDCVENCLPQASIITPMFFFLITLQENTHLLTLLVKIMLMTL